MFILYLRGINFMNCKNSFWLIIDEANLQVVAFDRYSRDTVVGECVYRLADAELMLHQEMRSEFLLRANII